MKTRKTVPSSSAKSASKVASFMAYMFIFESFILTVHGFSASSRRIPGNFGNVQVEYPSQESYWTSAWPEGIRLFNPFGTLTLQRALGVNSSSADPFVSEQYPYYSRQRAMPLRRSTYFWQGEQLYISVTWPTEPLSPVTSRPVPPLSWLTRNGNSKVRVLTSTETPTSIKFHDARGNNEAAPFTADEMQSRLETYLPSYTPSSSSASASSLAAGEDRGRVVEIAVSRTRVERSLGFFRTYGLKRVDIFRLLDKAPWVLALDLTSSLPRLSMNLQLDLHLNQAEAAAVISHCPMLLAQYSSLAGRDVALSYKALIQCGYNRRSLMQNIIRFPSMLATPPERVLAWRSLLVTGYGIGKGRSGLDFGVMLTKAPFMFNLDPPAMTIVAAITTTAARAAAEEEEEEEEEEDSKEITAEDTIHVLQLLQSMRSLDMDKVIRSVPFLLLESPWEVAQRLVLLTALLSLLKEAGSKAKRLYPADTPLPLVREVKKVWTSSSSSNSKKEVNANAQLFGTPPESIDAFLEDTDTAVQTVTVKKEKAKCSSLLPFNHRLAATRRALTRLSHAIARAHSSPAAMQLITALSKEQQKELSSFIEAAPKILSIPHAAMLASIEVLESAGFKSKAVAHMSKRCPMLLTRSESELRGTLFALNQHCGLRGEVILSVAAIRPELLLQEAVTLQQRAAFLYRTLALHPEDIRHCPEVLLQDDTIHQKLLVRIEFLRAMNSPYSDLTAVKKGLRWLLFSSDEDISKAANQPVSKFQVFTEYYQKQVILPAVNKHSSKMVRDQWMDQE